MKREWQGCGSIDECREHQRQNFFIIHNVLRKIRAKYCTEMKKYDLENLTLNSIVKPTGWMDGRTRKRRCQKLLRTTNDSNHPCPEVTLHLKEMILLPPPTHTHTLNPSINQILNKNYWINRYCMLFLFLFNWVNR